ncbi:hypothetical protein NLX69_08975 [Rossellomorea sp. BNER]|nr:hypothetical protein [Rossellomorea sp. BNER]
MSYPKAGYAEKTPSPPIGGCPKTQVSQEPQLQDIEETLQTSSIYGQT